MPFNKIRTVYVRAKPVQSFFVFLTANIIALLMCMIYPVIMMLSEYSDERVMSKETGNFQNFINGVGEIFVEFVFYSAPVFVFAAALYLMKAYQRDVRIRRITYVLTGFVLFAFLYVDTGLGLGHVTIYGTAVLYVAALYTSAHYMADHFGTI